MNVFCTYIFGPCVYWVVKNIKTQRRLGRCRILNALTLENLRVRIQNRVLLLGFVPFLLYRTHALLL